MKNNFINYVSERSAKILSRLIRGLYKGSTSYDDLFQEAVKIILVKEKEYKKSFGSFDDFIYNEVRAGLIRYIRVSTEITVAEDIGVTEELPYIDYVICEEYIKFFEEDLTQLERYIIVSYFYLDKPIYKVANELNTSSKRVSTIIGTYSKHIKETMKWFLRKI